MRALNTLLLVGLLAGCGDGEGVGTAYIAAEIDGVTWRQPASEGIVVYSVGTSAIDGEEAAASFSSCPNDVLADCIGWEAIPSDPGTLEITAIDAGTGRITGTFSFTGYVLGDSTGTTKNFTAGSFDIRAPGVFALE